MTDGRSIFCALVFVLCAALAPQGGVGAHVRPRRSLSQLSAMVSDVTGRKSTDFISYGNWCGLGGSGRPLDAIDLCCQIHDLCYDVASRGACKKLGKKAPYKTDYGWRKGRDGGARCNDEESDHCKWGVCSCDAMLVNCLRDNLDSYDPSKLREMSFSELMQEANWIASP